MEDKIRRIKDWSIGKKPGPIQVQFNPTDRCNLKCRFCWQRDTSRVSYENEISEDRYLKLIDECAELEVKHITVTGGGEPMCRPETTSKIMEAIKQKGMSGTLITNGTIFTKKIIKELVELEWDEIIFSVDSPNESIHDWLRQSTGSHKKTIENIELFNQQKKELSKDKPKLCIHFVLCNENHNQIFDMAKFTKDLGLINLFIEPVVTVAFETDIGAKLKLNENELKETIRQIKKAERFCNKNSIQHNIGSLGKDLIGKTNKMTEVIIAKAETKNKKKSFSETLCFEPFYNVIIRPNGRVGPCCMFDHSGEYIHDKSLNDIWCGKHFESIRTRLVNQELLDYCKQCNPSQVVENIKIRKVLKKKLR